MINNKKLEEVYEKTNGHCHFCGDKVIFKKYGLKNTEDVRGVWEADHIRQKGKGGDKDVSNCLPACYRCNRLRWHRNGEEIRELLFLGLITKNEIKKETELGEKIKVLKNKRELQNIRRRRSIV
ncbi:MAG: HNH endonuclease signature motif containing protein [bacterium]|nr:HNH endonuclease signature motif containing protein [bacterium]